MKNLTINVGDYVRNKYGIAKVLEISEDVVKQIQTIKFDRPICFWVNPKTGEERNRTNILPITPNIDLDKIKFGELINLIEEGDYVNGEKVIALKGDPYADADSVEDEDDVVYTDFDREYGEWLGYKEIEINSIVTHEQIEAMEYKIER